MSALSDLLAEHTDLGDPQVAQLGRLVGDWQIVADLAFADLLLWVPGHDGDLICMAHVRPTTSATSHPGHEIGRQAGAGQLSWLRRALSHGGIIRDRDPEWAGEIPIRPEGIAVRVGSEIVAVLGRDTNLGSPRTPSQLELAYLDAAGELLHMITDGTFPDGPVRTPDALNLRVGDGFVRLDAGGTVRYGSPNALSAFRRMGLTADLGGRQIGELACELATPGPEMDAALDFKAAVGGAEDRVSRTGEISAGSVTVAYRIITLKRADARPGTVLLLRDTTDLRSRDLALLSKDATIREIHHRVKNNLQTVAALLRLQGRRVHHPAARSALAESVRRVSSIALVHETLAVSPDGAADLDGILDALVPMLSEVTAVRPQVRIERIGRLGELNPDLATPLVMVLAELLNNAVEHGFADGRRGQVVLEADRGATELTVRITDDGSGLPPGFSLEASDSLGLQIVRTLVESEMRGSIRIRPLRGRSSSADPTTNRPGAQGTEAVLVIPVNRPGPGGN